MEQIVHGSWLSLWHEEGGRKMRRWAKSWVRFQENDGEQNTKIVMKTSRSSLHLPYDFSSDLLSFNVLIKLRKIKVS